MKITSSLPGLYDKTLSSRSVRIADERKEASLTIAEQLGRIKQEFKVNSLLTSGNKQLATQKAAALRQRLEMLKSLMRFATPEMAKALAQQLKGVAKELASLGQALGGGAGATAAPAAAPDTAAASSAPANAEAAAGGAANSAGGADATAARDVSTQGAAQPDASDDPDNAGRAQDARQAQQSGPAGAGEDDKALRSALQEARKLLKELIARLKSLARAGDDDARRDLRAAEKSVDELGRALEQNGTDTVTTGVDIALSTAVGGTIDVSA